MLIESGKSNGKKNALSDFLKKNKSMVYLLPILLIGIVAVITVYSKPRNRVVPEASIPASTAQSNPEIAGNQGLEVEVLPQMERVKQPEDLNLAQIEDPFEAGVPALFLKGIILSEKSDSAIIETESRAYIVSVGDSIDSFWHVEKIEDQQVTLEDKNGNPLVLTMNNP